MNKSFLITAALAGAAQAWWDKGHLLVARIAYDILERENPAALEGANEDLAILKGHSTILALGSESDYPFVECAVFADTIKGQGYTWQSSWHFVNNPYLDESKNIEDYSFVFDP